MNDEPNVTIPATEDVGTLPPVACLTTPDGTYCTTAPGQVICVNTPNGAFCTPDPATTVAGPPNGVPVVAVDVSASTSDPIIDTTTTSIAVPFAPVLPATGSTSTPIVGAATVLLLAGVCLSVLARRGRVWL